ncbi:MAG: pyrroline-5-carboxylate reductase [Candidatus Eisenbacteria bacterium]|uniref:Pyrroline-5-carboxylate reductase n=1 Tax=Eiseniibacteriota bacterium TaxID=2212470 RepID=A0A538TRR4_UNCEI|nr:MAG: pyrroline-5-carboxylate reductase [Candidatus Eisenbacteria bacterium]
MPRTTRLAILGAGNIGAAIAEGLVQAGGRSPADITVTRRKTELLESFRGRGFTVSGNNREAVRGAVMVLVAVEPQQIDGLLREIAPDLKPGAHTLISVVSGVSIAQIRAIVGTQLAVVRAMPNTAIGIRDSMTCITSDDSTGGAVTAARSLFDAVGKTLVIDEEQMVAATALGACGVAFFLRAIRAASQGGIEVGLQTDEALLIAAQTARGAASLLLSREGHPEREIDRVTTPRGCTITGLNVMEHEGFSSAMIRGIVASAEKASKLYRSGDG